MTFRMFETDEHVKHEKTSDLISDFSVKKIETEIVFSKKEE
jgi:hypothetical protein